MNQKRNSRIFTLDREKQTTHQLMLDKGDVRFKQQLKAALDMILQMCSQHCEKTSKMPINAGVCFYCIIIVFFSCQ